jgi:hypothetical protein
MTSQGQTQMNTARIPLCFRSNSIRIDKSMHTQSKVSIQSQRIGTVVATRIYQPHLPQWPQTQAWWLTLESTIHIYPNDPQTQAWWLTLESTIHLYPSDTQTQAWWLNLESTIHIYSSDPKQLSPYDPGDVYADKTTKKKLFLSISYMQTYDVNTATARI